MYPHTIKPARAFFFLSTLTLLTSCNPMQQIQQLSNPGQFIAPSIHPVVEMVGNTSDTRGDFVDGNNFTAAPNRSYWKLRMPTPSFVYEITAEVKLELSELFFALNPNTPRSILDEGIMLQFKSPNLRVALWDDTTFTYAYQDLPVWQTQVATLPTMLKLKIRNQDPNQFVPASGMIEMFVCPVKEKISCYTVAMELAPEYEH